VSRILRRHDLPYLCELDPLTGTIIRASKTTAVRYERSRPGELVHMDVKKIGRIPNGGGWRAQGRRMGSTSARKRARTGFDYVHSLVDDHSRLAYSLGVPSGNAGTGVLHVRLSPIWARSTTDVVMELPQNESWRRSSPERASAAIFPGR
jgi:hypothetical protein